MSKYSIALALAGLIGTAAVSIQASPDDEKFAVVPYKSQTFATKLKQNSTARQQTWLAEQKLATAGLSSKPVWQGNLDWSMQDRGFCEGDVQKEWNRLGIWQACIRAPGAGRVTAMQIAIQEAKAGHCARAFEIAVSTQLHNIPAANTIRSAGADAVCEYLKHK